MDLRNLIDRNGQDLTIISETEGEYVGGIWQEGTQTEITVFGVLLNMTGEDVQNSTSGKYTLEDKKIVVKDDVTLSKDDKLKENGVLYNIVDLKDQSFHGRIKTYMTSKVVD